MKDSIVQEETLVRSPRVPSLPPYLITLLTLSASIVVLVGMHLGQELIGPLAIAAVIVLICNPIRKPLERRGWPHWAATLMVVLLSFTILLLLALMLAYALGSFAALAMEYTGALRTLGNSIVELAANMGWDTQLTDALDQVLTPSFLIGTATSLGGSALGAFTALFFIFAYMIFMAADASRYSRASEEYGPEADGPMRRFAHYGQSVRRYYVVNAAFGLIVAVVDGVALWLLNVPGALVWAILAFVTNFVPNIGFILGLVPPVLMALVVGGWPLALAVTGIYIVANVVLQVLIQPKFVSDAVDLSLTLSFFSVLFWTFVIGPLGAILSIPLTLLARSLILEGDRRNRWVLWLSGDNTQSGRPAPQPGEA